MRAHLFTTRFFFAAAMLLASLMVRPAFADLAADHAVLQKEYETLINAPMTRAVDFPDGRSLRPGDHSRDVPLLRVALADYGFKPDTTSDENPTLYDAALVDAVRRFQGEVGVKDDGILGAASRKALRGMDGNRLLRLEQSLAQPAFPETGRYIYVNLAAGMAYAMRDGKVEIASKAIIGKPGKDTQTPFFTTVVHSITMNPTWTATKTIRDREFGGNPHVEKPGPNNPLGKIRIDMQDPYLVYMHSTNHPQLFSRDQRAFSHGCVRIEKIKEFARWITGDNLWSDEDLDASMSDYVSKRVNLDEGVPVYMQYRTATVATTGEVIYHLDPYHQAAPPESVIPAAIPEADPLRATSADASASRIPNPPIIPAAAIVTKTRTE